MSRQVQLRQIAHARAGDKGNISNIALFVFHPQHYEAVKRQLTPDFLKRQLGGVLRGPVYRYEIESLQALNFVMVDALEGGVNRSLNLDAHGKSWSYLLLSLEIELEDDDVVRSA
jgi:hypothetical protein